MQRKRLFTLFALLLIAVFALAACAQQPAPTEAPSEEQPTAMPKEEGPVEPAKEIVIYNWSDYVAPEMYELFEKETGIKVIEDNFSSNEDLLAKLQGGAAGYALIVPSDYTVAIMIEEGLIQKIDHANIPNLKNLDAEFTEMYFDPGNEYCVTYLWGTTGIGYNNQEVENPPTSWKQIFEAQESDPWYGRMTLLDDVREVFSSALIYLGYDNNSTDEAQLAEARDLLIKAKKGISGFDSDTYEELIGSGENLVAHGWNGDFLQANDEFENIGYLVPEEGGTIWIDNMCIPASATPEEKLAAEMYMNFVLRPDIGAMLADYTYYATPNKAALAEMDEEYTQNPIIFPPEEVRAKLRLIKPLGEFESVYQRMWDEIKAAQ
jgi:spermidine/putrescine transport system substrate-binding protein